ncbi:Phenylalanine--tRNA ligase beta subunit [anaerobic digester metagenome]|uniref:tRNA-binding protein n=1 Tax=Methanobacterium subterraneum TaxID=59277 RepID=A0A2H4VC81_9EURY|nr:tRNA-binding protein [Methanobacterium subterraneum]AUB55704.1 tRNA-binding protein [Methanobacterium subterraneum]
MWDTSNDYRLLVAEKSVELFMRSVEGANLKGKWNKKQALQAARKMTSEIQTLYYSYLEPAAMIETPQISLLEDQGMEIVEALGGESWNRQFMELANREEKPKLEEALAKIKFFLNTISGLKDRISLGEIKDPVMGVDIKKGEILSVSKHPEADQLLVCNVNLHERAITVVTNDLDVKEKNQVAVALLPPEVFMGITSEGMFLGAGEGILKDVKGDLGKLPQGIPLEALNEARNLVENFLQ